VLVVGAHHRKIGGLVPVEAAPGMETDIGFPVLLPGGDSEKRGRDAPRHLKVGEELELLGVGRLEPGRKTAADLDLHPDARPFPAIRPPAGPAPFCTAGPARSRSCRTP